MDATFEHRLNALVRSGRQSLLHGGKKGLEKESLRVTPDGKIAQTPHPRALGSALTHPNITTDYSEALLEFVTAPFTDTRDTMAQLRDIHQFAYANIGDELLWATSMPCVVDGDRSIPIARYGTSNVGMMKHVYRRGLDYRYGRAMQAISGIHFNYSFSDGFWELMQSIEGDTRERQAFISDAYFCLIRNFQRFGWLVPFLFGASPAVCKSFLKGRDPGFSEFDAGTVYEPYATSLRMSDIGYKNKAQASLNISYNNLQDYVATLTRAIETPDPEYAAIGTVVDGEYRQLNTNVLQIENEYYSFVRPKNPAHSGEKPTLALKHRGVQYVEIRALDVNPFEPTGVSEPTLHFMEAFMAYCLLRESPPIDADEQRAINQNQAQVARSGRDPDLELRLNGCTRRLRDWASDICAGMTAICAALDDGETGCPYAEALDIQRAVVEDANRSPSARVLREMRERGEAFVEFAMRVSRTHKAYFQGLAMDPDRFSELREAAEASLAEQARIEASDTLSFEAYLERYFAQR